MEREPGVRALLALFADFHLVDLLIRDEAQACGIRTYSLGLLYFIDAAGEITPTELAGETGLPPTTLRRWLDELDRRGEIERRPHPDDGRSFIVALTAKGRASKVRGAPAMRGAVKEVERHLGWKLGELEARLEELRSALRTALGYDGTTTPDDRRRFWVDEEPPRRR